MTILPMSPLSVLRRPPGHRVMRLLVLALVLAADPCTGDRNACDSLPAGGLGEVVTQVQAAADPCVGRPVEHIVAWFTRQGTPYPLRCGRRDPRGYGYLHYLQARVI
jgi:hypothetical protein